MKYAFLPKSENISLKVYGNGLTLGLTNGSTKIGLSGVSDGDAGFAGRMAGNTSAYGKPYGSSGGRQVPANSLGVTTDKDKSGLIADGVIQSQQVNLYIKY